MFEEAQLFSPVEATEEGDVRVHLADDHPGANDPDYRRRRDAIAAAALNWKPGEPVPTIEYTEDEQGVWRLVSAELKKKHERLAARECIEAHDRLGLPEDRIPQLEELSATISALTGFRYVPAAGLVPLRDFLGKLGDRFFHSSQYIRHHGAPLYTPEPDLIHETIGHGSLLASDRFADLKYLAGTAAQRVETDEALQFLANVFWYTLEFGVVYEDGELKCYGAGLLSSFGEIEEFRNQEIRPLDIADMGTLEFDITHYQPVLFAGKSLDHLTETLTRFFNAADDDMCARLAASRPARTKATV